MQADTKTQSGFSLLEILMGIAVLVVLIALCLPFFRSLQEKRDQLRCLTNLREIGVAVFAYVEDHNGQLPGPVTGGIRARYSRGNLNDPRHLSAYLVPYLGDPVPVTNEYLMSRAFICPAAMRFISGTDLVEGRTYSQVPSRFNGEANITDSSGKNLYPFGYKASGGNPDEWHDPVTLSSIQRPGQTFAVLDRRNLAPGIDSGHKEWRNILFLDGNVRRVDLTDFISFTEIRQ